MVKGDCVYSASSVFRNFTEIGDVKVNWFTMLEYFEDPNNPWFDEWPNQEYWSKVVAGYMRLDKRARWKARHYVSQFFPEHFLKCLTSFVEEKLKTSVVVERVPLPIRFKDRASGTEPTPYLFISNYRNTIFFDPMDYWEEDDGLFFVLCGYLNFGEQIPQYKAISAESLLKRHLRSKGNFGT